MWVKISLGVLLVAMIVAAVHFDPARERSLLATRPSDGPRLKLMTWNIGYATFEEDSRAHTSDLRSVARTILRSEPDAVALQELTGPEQLDELLEYLKPRYRGSVGTQGATDR